MTGDILFSVLIANYNNGLYINEAIESLQKQDYKNWEAIIVDDASVDNSVELISAYLKDSRIKLFTNNINQGCGYSKRKCAELATGSICGFLDPDDALLPEAISTMIEAHRNETGYSMIYSTHYRCDAQLLNPVRVDYGGGTTKGYSYLLDPLKKPVSHFVAFKKEFYARTAGIDPALRKAVDQDLYYKLEETAPAKYIDVPLYLYRIHNRGISAGANAIPALILHYKVKIAALGRRSKLAGLAQIYPKDKDVFDYEMLKSRMFLYKLSGKRLKGLQFFFQVLLKYPGRLFKEFIRRQPAL